MKQIATIFSVLFSLLVTGCSGNGSGSEEDHFLLAFRLTCAGTTYNGNIDNEGGVIMFEDITDGKDVEDAAAYLAEGATISPEPASYVGNWPAESVFEVCKGNSVKRYEVLLPNLVDKTRSNQVVMGYVQPTAWNFDNYLSLIDWDCRTHILPSFCYGQPDASLKTDVLDNYIARIASEAKKNDVKVIVSVRSTGGQSYFSTAIATPELREKLACNVMEYVRRYDLDGVDIDLVEYEKIGNILSQLYDVFVRCRS